MKKKISEAEAWCDRELAKLSEEFGMVPSKKFAPVTVPDLKPRRPRQQPERRPLPVDGVV